jgi:hypothetical protein
VLEAEGVFIDPIGAILAVLVLELSLAPDAGSLALSAQGLVLRLGFGAAMGVGAGFLLGKLLWIPRLLPEGHENIFVLASILLLFQGCDQLISHSGILAVTLCGVVVGNMETRVDRDLREFKDQLTVLLVGLIFVMLAADVRLEHIQRLGANGLAVVAALVIAVRPLGVWLSTLGSELSARERIFVAWVAPRGIVAAAVASLVAGSLESHGMQGSVELRALVFLTIAATVVLAGFTAAPLASRLDLRLPGRDSVAILGAEGLGLALARELREAGTPVVFLDSNPQTCRMAEEAGFPVVFGNAMEERTLRRARFESVGTAMALTPNQTVNSAFVSRARDLFRVPRALVAVERVDTGLASELIKSEQAEVAFEGPHDLERWGVRTRRDEVVIEHRVFSPPQLHEEEPAGAPEGRPVGGERFAILALRRDGKTLPMCMGLEPREGDVAAIAVYLPDREEADRLLGELGWRPAGEGENPGQE